jgi:hypothetical protein
VLLIAPPRENKVCGKEWTVAAERVGKVRPIEIPRKNINGSHSVHGVGVSVKRRAPKTTSMAKAIGPPTKSLLKPIREI